MFFFFDLKEVKLTILNLFYRIIFMWKLLESEIFFLTFQFVFINYIPLILW